MSECIFVTNIFEYLNIFVILCIGIIIIIISIFSAMPEGIFFGWEVVPSETKKIVKCNKMYLNCNLNVAELKMKCC